MKIAFPTMDGVDVSSHFGRSRGFLVLEADQGRVLSREVRENRQGQPSEIAGGCQGHAKGVGAGHGHDHGAFARLLADCDVVVVRGMGAGALNALREAGLRICRVGEGVTPEQAVALLEADGLLDLAGSTCGCRGHH